MKVAIFTNTYTPHVGGVARSVQTLVDTLNALDCETLVIAPEFANMPPEETGVIRVPAIQHFSANDFSIPAPVNPFLGSALYDFMPDIVHAHHPFLLGDTALRSAAMLNRPTVYTFHTRYDLYEHYLVPGSDTIKRLVRALSIGYCNLCNAVIAPSESIAEYLSDHDVAVPVSVIPTGIDLDAFDSGDGETVRKHFAIDDNAWVIGHVGRLAHEKNLGFLTEALIDALRYDDRTMALIVGNGGARAEMEARFRAVGLEARVRFSGVLSGGALEDAYAAMDVFAFSSKSETQGLVLVEAMAAGVPVVAMDAPGVREVMRDGENGRLLGGDVTAPDFAVALNEVLGNRELRQHMRQGALVTAAKNSKEDRAKQVLRLYETICAEHKYAVVPENSTWGATRRALSKEIDLLANLAYAVGEAVMIGGDADAQGVRS